MTRKKICEKIIFVYPIAQKRPIRYQNQIESKYIYWIKINSFIKLTIFHIHFLSTSLQLLCYFGNYKIQFVNSNRIFRMLIVC